MARCNKYSEADPNCQPDKCPHAAEHEVTIDADNALCSEPGACRTAGIVKCVHGQSHHLTDPLCTKVARLVGLRKVKMANVADALSVPWMTVWRWTTGQSIPCGLYRSALERFVRKTERDANATATEGQPGGGEEIL